MNNFTCECKDNKLYYVLAGGGLVLLTYIIKNTSHLRNQQLHSHQPSLNHEKSSNIQKINNLENQINTLKKQLDDQKESIQRYIQYKNSNLRQPPTLTVQQMNDKMEDTKRRFMFNMM